MLDAGGLETVAEPIDGEVAGLIVGSGSSVDGGIGTVQLIGGAIDTRGASIAGSDVFADVRNPPSVESPQSDDGGQLADSCLDGDICLGSITATGLISIGQGEETPVRFLGTGNMGGDSVAIRSRETLTFGSATVPLTTSAGGAITLESQSGDVELLGGATLSGGSVDVSAGGSLIGNGALVSTGDVGITVGDSVNASAIIADGQLTGFGQTGGETEGLFSVPGSFVVSTLQLGAEAAIAAGGDILVDSASLDGNDLAFTADGLVSLGSTAQVGDIALSGNRAEFGALLAGGNIAIEAQTSVTGSSAEAGGSLTIDGGTIAANDLISGGNMALASIGATSLGRASSGADLNINSGALNVSALISSGATTINAASVAGGDVEAGSSLAVTSGGSIGLGSASAGTTLAFDGGSITANSLASGGNAILTADTVDVASIDSGGGIAVTGGSVALGSTQSAGLTKVGAGTLVLSSAEADGGLQLAVEGEAELGTVQSGAGVSAIAGDLSFTTITASGDISASAGTIGGGDATSTAGAVTLTSTRATTVGQLLAATDVSVAASSLSFAGIEAARDVSLDIGMLDGSVIEAGRDLTIRSVDSLTFETVGAGRDVLLSSSNGTLTITTDLDAGGTATLFAGAIGVLAAGDLRVNSAGADNGNISIVTDGLLRVDSATAIGDITLTSTANSLIVGGAAAGESPNVGTAFTAESTSGSGAIGGGAITFSAANDVTTLGTVDALTSLATTAGRLIDQRGLAVGRTVDYRSADIALGQGASLGQSNFTTGIALTSTGSAGAILGDMSGTTAGYRLDNAEFGRVHSGGDLSIAGGSSLSVGTLSASAASGSGGVANGNIGATSALSLSTNGELAVSGALALANAGGNTLNLTSGGALFIDAGSGSVRLVEGSASGGTLAVSAGSIMALTPPARAAIAGLDTRALDQRLSMNDGVTAGRTLLEGGAITLSSNGAILIQNTSPGISFDERRGLVADSLTLVTRGETSGTSGLADIVINGTVAGTTGLTALRAVAIDGSFSDFSTINGCRIVSASCGNPAIDPIRDLIEEEVEVGSTLENSADGFGQSPLITINRIEPAGFETVIDEPVTGAGNDDFLVPEAGAGDEVCAEEDQTNCDKPPAG